MTARNKIVDAMEEYADQKIEELLQTIAAEFDQHVTVSSHGIEPEIAGREEFLYAVKCRLQEGEPEIDTQLAAHAQLITNRPSNLQDKSVREIRNMAEEIASESFVKHGNKQVPWNENDDLRKLIGGRYAHYPDCTRFVVEAYNDKYTSLILSNI